MTPFLAIALAAGAVPLSTTHDSTGAIVGVGTGQRGAVAWGTVRTLLGAWVVTLPLAAALGIASWLALREVGL